MGDVETVQSSQQCGHCGKSYDDTGTPYGNCSEACDLAADAAADLDRGLREHIAAVVAEERRRVRVALRQVAADQSRSERERELLLDLVEALGGEAAT